MKELSTHMADVSEWYGRDDAYICWTVRMGGEATCPLQDRRKRRREESFPWELGRGYWEEGVGKSVLGRGYWEEGIGKEGDGKWLGESAGRVYVAT